MIPTALAYILDPRRLRVIAVAVPLVGVAGVVGLLLIPKAVERAIDEMAGEE